MTNEDILNDEMDFVNASFLSYEVDFILYCMDLAVENYKKEHEKQSQNLM